MTGDVIKLQLTNLVILYDLVAPIAGVRKPTSTILTLPDGHALPNREAADLQATPLRSRASLRATQPREEGSSGRSQGTSCGPASRCPASPTRCSATRDVQLQASEEPLVQERSHNRPTEAKRPEACRQEARLGQLPQVHLRYAKSVGAAYTPASWLTIRL